MGVVRPSHARASPDSYDRASFPELEYLRSLLPAETLAWAASRAASLNTGADRVLIAQRIIEERAYLQRLSVRSGIGLTDLAGAEIASPDADLRLAAQSGMLWVRIDGRALLVVTLRGKRAREIVRMASEKPREIGHLRLTTEQALQDFLLYRTGGIIGPAIADLHARHPALSAAPVRRHWLHRAARKTGLLALGLVMLAATLAFPAATGNLLALVFLAAIGLRLAASLCAVETPLARRIQDADLPDYSVIVALYREERSVPQLLDALLAFDYPREKLDIILVVETDDLATRAAIARARPPACVRIVVAPNQGPRTKPKALNVALPFARGAYIAVFDAEDRPDADQLRIALAAFRRGDDNLACVQARLAIHNSGKSFFTRMFAAEYAGQFDITMPGYDRFGLPWPLGGTSNHFDAAKLRVAGAWDPFNVTEDADLGLRFARFRYATATIDSTTWEESPITYSAWLHQRTRWMKGWMQTWAVHMRHPRRYWRRTGWPGMVSRDLIIGGALLAALAYPVSLVLIAAKMLADCFIADGSNFIGTLFSPLHIASFVGGLAVSILIQARGLAFRDNLHHAWVLIFTPLYWLCLSAAAWRALFQLRSDPYKWEKTEHGVEEDDVAPSP